MKRIKLFAVAAAVTALVAGPVGAAPAHAQDCSIFEGDVAYVCDTARDTVDFAYGELNEAYGRVVQLYYDIGALGHDVYCMVFPGLPECQ